MPPGFAVSADAYRRDAPLPDGLRAELEQRYAELGSPPVAVRSSALGEDGADASFAGQQETYLWVRGADAVCDAVRDCWASLFSPEAVSYRARLGRSDEQAAMGVTVQRMVDAAVSGVLFTCNPVSGDPSTVAVNASWGLGLAVVGGEVTPDEYRVSKVTREVLHRAVASKHVEYVPDPGGAGTVRVDVPEERRDAACLDDEQLRTLVDLGTPDRAPLRLPPGRRVGDRARRGASCSSSSRGRSRSRRGRRRRPGASAIELVMGTFGAKR